MFTGNESIYTIHRRTAWAPILKTKRNIRKHFSVFRNNLSPPGPGIPFPGRVATGLPVTSPRGFPMRLSSFGGATPFGRTGGGTRRVNGWRRLSHLWRLRGRRKTRWRRRVGHGPRARAALTMQSQWGARGFRGIAKSRGLRPHIMAALRIQGGRKHHHVPGRNLIPRRWQGAVLIEIYGCRVISGGHGDKLLPEPRGICLPAVVRAHFVRGWY